MTIRFNQAISQAEAKANILREYLKTNKLSERQFKAAWDKLSTINNWIDAHSTVPTFEVKSKKCGRNQ
jgi:hypothetical protein